MENNTHYHRNETPQESCYNCGVLVGSLNEQCPECGVSV